jgi:Cu(I)/Ag(I) efflux system membrane fusion protein
VYVKLPGADHPTFKMREITLGNSMKNTYVVMDGLAEGEEIVTNGAFSVDAAAQLAGKVSMMNPAGEKVSTGSHAGMDMGAATATPSATQSRARSETATQEHQTIKVSGNCEMCKDRIETAAKSVTGVSSADWSTETKMLHVQFDGAKTNLDAIQKVIAKAGHDTDKHKATDAAYKALPECCLYRK